MKRQATVCICFVIVLLLGCGFLLARTAQARMSGDDCLVSGGDPPGPGSDEGIWGPDVGEPCTASPTRLAPMAIGEDQLAANSTIQSDDFNACSLDTERWTFYDPDADSTMVMVGTFSDDAWLSISVPSTAGGHDIYLDGNHAPRIMQDVSNSDFEIEVKFESAVNQTYQMLGMLIEQDIDNFLRFEFHSRDSYTRLYVAIFEPDPSPSPPHPLTVTVPYNQPITDANVAPLWMRVQRQDDQWREYHSFDGSNWTNAVTFTHALTVAKVGTYASNMHPSGGGPAPAYTGYVDYFFNTASPIDPEDGARAPLTVHTVGNGSVAKDPDKANYACDEEVELTADPDACWLFSGWSGDLSGSDNPETVTMDGGSEVTATFSADLAPYTLTVDTVGDGTVAKYPDQSTYLCGSPVALTATAAQGWFFTEWSGSLSGTNNPDTLTILGNEIVTGTFSSHLTHLPFACRNY
jgi:regulation of enolase protein 1 (concanavalin A-like superfamily)